MRHPFEQDYTETTAQPPTPKVWTPKALVSAAHIQLPPFLLDERALSPGSFTLIAGRRGVGKTYLTLALARAIALGEFFGHLKTNQANVFYISQELGEASMKARMARLFTPAQLEALEPSFLLSCKVKGIKLDTDDGAKILAGLIADHHPSLVFLDALRYFKGAYSENSNDDMGQLCERLIELVLIPTETACGLIHHMGKPKEDGSHGGGRGASAIEDTAADILYLTRAKDSTTLRRGELEKARDSPHEGEVFGFRIESPEGDESRISIDIFEAEKAADEDQEMNRLRDLLDTEGGSLTAPELESKLGWSTRSRSRHVNRAKALNFVRVFGGRKGAPQTVTLIVTQDDA